MEPIVFQPKVKRKYLIGEAVILCFLVLFLFLYLHSTNYEGQFEFRWVKLMQALMSMAPLLLLACLYGTRLNVKRICLADTIAIHRFVGKSVSCDPKGFRYQDEGLYVFANYTLYPGMVQNAEALHGAFQAMAGQGLLELRQPSEADLKSRRRRTATVWSVIIPVSILFLLFVAVLEVSETMIAIAGLAYLIIVSVCFRFMWKDRPLN